MNDDNPKTNGTGACSVHPYPTTGGACPYCGRCPGCGRPYGYNPWYPPYTPYHPYTPYWVSTSQTPINWS